MLAQTMIERAKAIQDWMVKIRRDFHKYPELSSQEKRTRDMITSYLKSLEIPYLTINFAQERFLLELMFGIIIPNVSSGSGSDGQTRSDQFG